jgi:Flp pilus assembly protein TadD
LEAFEEALRYDSTDATAYRGKGHAQVGLGLYHEALLTFERATALTPQPATYVSMGSILAKLSRYEEAVNAYEQALRLDATYSLAYVGLSNALSRLGRTQEAEQAYTQAKQLGEED